MSLSRGLVTVRGGGSCSAVEDLNQSDTIPVSPMPQSILTAFLYVLSALILFTGVCGWRQTAQLLGGFSLKPARQTAQFAGSSRHLLRWILLLVGTTAAIALAVTTTDSGYGPLHRAWACACISTCLAAAMRALQPPVVLFLTSSSPYAARLLWSMNLGLVPLRAVALLDPHRMSLTRRLSLLNDNLRTRDGAVWKSVVHHLIEMTAVVVIDTRGDSEAVGVETSIMLDPRRVRKVLFITTPDGRSPALEVHGIDPADHALQTVTEDELIDRLRHWTRSPESLPCPVNLSAIQDGGPLRRETLDSLPSVLVFRAVDSFDSRRVVEHALQSGQDLLVLDGPLSAIGEQAAPAAQWMFDLSWEFLHEPGLALLVYERSGRVVVRIDFLREVVRELNSHSARAPTGRLTFEQLNQPEPIWAAIMGLAYELVNLSEARSRTYRFIPH